MNIVVTRNFSKVIYAYNIIKHFTKGDVHKYVSENEYSYIIEIGYANYEVPKTHVMKFDGNVDTRSVNKFLKEKERNIECDELLEYIRSVMKNNDLRFGQLMYNLGLDFDKEYNTENKEMLNIIMKELNKK